MVRRLLDESIEIRTVMEPALWPVKVDSAQFEQVLVNLVVNAGDAMPDGGVLAIETRNVEFRPPPSGGERSDAAAGPYVLLQVSDTGTGMDEATRAHIFEPFFTTKDQGKGTGLGLAMVYGIVQQSGGHIVVESAPGAGTTCRIYLPRAAAAAGAAGASVTDESAARPRGGTETILLVEDERPVRFLARQALERQGYRVLEASSGEEACAMAEAHDGIDLLVTDVSMPDMNGKQLATILRGRAPDSEDRVHLRVRQDVRGVAGIREGRGLLSEAVHRRGPGGRGAEPPRRPRGRGSGRRLPAAAPRRARLIAVITRSPQRRQLLRGRERIRVAAAGPGDAPEQDAAHVRRGERAEVVPEQRDEGAVRPPPFELILVDPDLRDQPADLRRRRRLVAAAGPHRLHRRREHVRVGRHVQVPIDFIRDREIRCALRDRMLGVDVVDRVLSLEELGDAVLPRLRRRWS